MRYKKRDPVDYSKCNQYVSVYHADFTQGSITQHNIPFAFFDFRKNENINRTGQTETNTFLLVIPKEKNNLYAQPIFNGDKVVLWTTGTPENLFTVGEEDVTTSNDEEYIIVDNDPVTTRSEWANFIPSKVPNMVVVKYVDPKYWKGEVVHWEAGG